jgi:amino acid transporter
MPNLPLNHIIMFAALLVLILIAVAIIYVLFKKPDTFATFLLEPGPQGEPGKPSVSRLQMLIWNFVVAFAFLYVLATKDDLAEVAKLLSPTVLTLLGISNGTYLLGKKITPGQARQPGEPGGGQRPQGAP